MDEFGNSLGQYIPIYGNLKCAMLCVSPNKGNSEVEQFGSFADYDRTMTTADTSLPIDENTVLWVDGADTSGPWNFIVKKVAPWKNSIQYAIKQVTVSQYQAEQETIAAALERKKQVEADKAAVVNVDAENNAKTE